MANTHGNDDLLNLSDDELYEWATTTEENQTPVPCITIVEEEEEEEQGEQEHLSQKLSQLSASEHDRESMETSTTTTTNKRSSLVRTSSSTVPKKMKIHHEQEVSNPSSSSKKIPPYLSANNKAFDQMMHTVLALRASSFEMEDLRGIAVLLHRIAVLEIQQSLWTTYLRSGTGTLLNKIPPPTTTTMNNNVSIWPMDVKKAMIKNCPTTNSDEIDDEMCRKYVNETLQSIINRRTEYEQELDVKKRRLCRIFPSDIEDAIQQFIEEEEISFLRIEMQSKMISVEYAFKDRFFELEFEQLNPSYHQRGQFQHFTKNKDEKETSKYEVAILKERFAQDFLPEPFATLLLPLPTQPSPTIDRIQKKEIRQELHDRYTILVEQTKIELMSLYIAIAENKMYECQTIYDHDMKGLRPDEREFGKYHRLSETMIAILERRLANIDQRVETLYNLKIRFLDKRKQKMMNTSNRRND